MPFPSFPTPSLPSYLNRCTTRPLTCRLQWQQRHILKKGNPATTCGDGDSFTITAPDASKIEGCYSEVVGCENAGEKTYSQTGTYDIGQTVVVAYKTDGSTSASSEVRCDACNTNHIFL